MQDFQEVLVTFVQILQCRNQTLDFCEAAMLGADGWNYTVPWHKWHPTIKAEGFVYLQCKKCKKYGISIISN